MEQTKTLQEREEVFSRTSIKWLIKYLQELQQSGETHVFSLIYDRHDASGYVYGWNEETQDKYLSLEEWERACNILDKQDPDLIWEVQLATEQAISDAETQTN